MNTETMLKLHQDHQQWGGEIAQWHQDVAVWEEELKSAAKGMLELQDMFEARAAVLRQHAAALRIVEENIDEHEHSLAQSAKAMPVEVAAVPTHQEEGKQQASLRVRHEDLKRRHHEFIAGWKMLVQSALNSV